MSGPLWQMTLAYTVGFYTHTGLVSATRAPTAAHLRPTMLVGDAHANRESDGRPQNCADSCHFSSFALTDSWERPTQGEAQVTLRTVRATFWDR